MEPPAPQAPPAPSTEDLGARKAKNQGKPKKEETQPEEIPSIKPPAPPPPPPAEDAGPPKAKNQGKPKQKEVAPPEAPSMGTPPSEPPPTAAEGGASHNGKKAKKGTPKAEHCPEGTMLLEDGSCAPLRQ